MIKFKDGEKIINGKKKLSLNERKIYDGGQQAEYQSFVF
jgi:hypothetical protein